MRPCHLKALVAMVILVLASACTTTNGQSVSPASTPVPAQSESTETMSQTAVPVPTPPPAPAGPTVEDATRFVADAETRLARLSNEQQRAQWVQSTYITDDTQAIAAAANEAFINAGVELAKGAARFDNLEVPYDVRRKLTLLKLTLTTPGPSDPAKTAEIARLGAELEGTYGAGKYCPPGKTGDDCLDVGEIGTIMRTSRDPKKLLEVWRGWHTISPPMKPDYTRFITLQNEGARELGYADTGALWRSNYDMSPQAFGQEVDRLWNQVKPLYDQLHCFVRTSLTKKYGASVVPPGQPIPAHLLGNIWAQEWGNIYDIVAPKNTP
ncbi:MAG TPA: M2 family metallopeptidase, partial [Thermoanaerobaculia bacterium]